MSKAKQIATKSVGNYQVKLLIDDVDPFLEVLWTGEWGSGEWVSLAPVADLEAYLDKHVKENTGKEVAKRAKEWFRDHLRGDLDVKDLLQKEYYDQYGNYTRRQ